MQRTLLRVLYGLVLLPAMAVSQPLVVATEVWGPNFTTPDSDGLYETIVKKVFHSEDIEFIYTSYSGSVNLVAGGKADFWLGSYATEVEDMVYPREPLDVDEVSALSLKQAPWLGMFALTPDQPVGWIQDYDYHLYFDSPNGTYYEVKSLEDGVRMLLGGRLSFLIDDRSVLQDYLSDHPEHHASLELQLIGYMPIYPGFNNSTEGRAYAALWDKRIKELRDSGWLAQQYKAYEVENLLEACEPINHNAPAKAFCEAALSD